jgi:hypothetical protein
MNQSLLAIPLLLPLLLLQQQQQQQHLDLSVLQNAPPPMQKETQRVASPKNGFQTMRRMQPEDRGRSVGL